ncbi:MAG: hypothetical protein RLZZ272_768 [Actinomycetota bacterium]
MTSDPSTSLTPDAWFARVAAALDEHHGSASVADGGTVDAATRDALLDLARIAAHSSERWTAPVTTWLVGIALAGSSPAERAARLAGLVAELGTGTDGSTGP